MVVIAHGNGTAESVSVCSVIYSDADRLLTISVGGSSAMNFYAWIKPPAEDINVYEELGNPGWNWESYQRCTMHTEKYVSPPLSILPFLTPL